MVVDRKDQRTMNVFIDLGCYDGDTVEEFRNWSKIAFPDKKDWKIFAFDPNPKFKNDWENKKDANTVFEQKAAWIEDGTIEVAIDSSEDPWGTTVMPGKKKIWDNNEKITVECFDFPRWIEKFEDDYVVVKCDVEGAEFPILERMLQLGTARIPQYLLVEFHPNKVQEYSTEDKNNLINKLRSNGTNVLEWH